jgi:hypothetical protein
MIAFYYLLRVGEYTIKGSRSNTKQTVQFKYEDVSFFKKNSRGQLRCLPRDASASLIATTNGATLKLDNQKNGLKGVCVYHESNGDNWHCPVRALARCYFHLRDMGAYSKTFLLAHYDDKGQCSDITNEDVSKALKAAVTVLDCTLRQRASRWIALTPICFGVAAPMPSPWRDIRIPRFKR